MFKYLIMPSELNIIIRILITSRLVYTLPSSISSPRRSLCIRKCGVISVTWSILADTSSFLWGSLPDGILLIVYPRCHGLSVLISQLFLNFARFCSSHAVYHNFPGFAIFYKFDNIPGRFMKMFSRDNIFQPARLIRCYILSIDDLHFSRSYSYDVTCWAIRIW